MVTTLLEDPQPHIGKIYHLTGPQSENRAGRFDRKSDEVLMLTGQGPLSVQEFVSKNAATFTT